MKSIKIKSIKQIKYSGQVHNLAVEVDETYYANNILVHNCRSFLAAILVGEDELPGFYENFEERFEPFGTNIPANAVNPTPGFGG